ncbi:MAG: aminotransferase class I/II-fold pyridoxal phosphate-dependent enzyme [Caldilineaceae bacterium]
MQANPAITEAGVSAPFRAATRVSTFTPTVFAEYTALCIEHNAVNLGQGFPNFPAPDFVKKAAQDAIGADLNQYTRSAGHLRLVKALANVFSPLFNRDLNPLTEIVVTDGATEAIYATIQALIEPGDEAIMLEPFYDSYPASVIMAGGTPVYVSIPPVAPQPDQRIGADWAIDFAALEAAFSERTRLLILNTPQNALGKVYSRTELERIAHLAQKYDVLVLADEVYEWMVYPDASRAEPWSMCGWRPRCPACRDAPLRWAAPARDFRSPAGR